MTPRTLKQMTNRPTCYEVGLFVDGEQIETLAFVARRTRRKLFDLCVQNGPDISAHMTDDELDLDYHATMHGVDFANGRVAVRFTGRTERDLASC